MTSTRLLKIIGLSGLITAWCSISTSIIVSRCFNILSMALSDLGDWTVACGNNAVCLQSCNRLSEPIFNYGLIVSGLLLASGSIGLYKYRRGFFSIPLIFASIALSFIGALPERYGVLHFLSALIFFLLLPISMLLFAISKRHIDRKLSALSIILSMISVTGIILFIYIKIRHLDLGYAIPEILGAAPATTWLEIIFLDTQLKDKK